MPFAPDLMEKMILLRFNRGPGPTLDLLGAMAYKTVSVAVQLGVFERLESGPLTAGEVAARIDGSEQGARLLLDALETLGYVKSRAGRYANTAMTKKWMVRGSRNHIGDFFPYFDDVLERWGNLKEAVLSGRTPTVAWEWLDARPDGWSKYNAAMAADARMTGEELVERVRVPVGARRLLDVGGGHGIHAINFCRRYPEMSATVFDWPQTRDAAEANITAEGMTERVVFQEGDLWEDDLGGGYDVALLFNIVHMYQSDRNGELIRRVAGALQPGGLLVIMDQMSVKASGPAARAMAALVGLDLFVEVNGRTYTPGEVVAWLKGAGLVEGTELMLRNNPGFAVVCGRKPGQAR